MKNPFRVGNLTTPKCSSFQMQLSRYDHRNVLRSNDFKHCDFIFSFSETQVLFKYRKSLSWIYCVVIHCKILKKYKIHFVQYLKRICYPDLIFKTEVVSLLLSRFIFTGIITEKINF